MGEINQYTQIYPESAAGVAIEQSGKASAMETPGTVRMHEHFRR